MQSKEDKAKTNFWGFSPEVMQNAKKRSKVIAFMGVILWILTALLISTRSGEGGTALVIVSCVYVLIGLLISKVVASIATGIAKKITPKANGFDYLAVTTLILAIIVLISNDF